jgi:hypothetical protein
MSQGLHLENRKSPDVIIRARLESYRRSAAEARKEADEAISQEAQSSHLRTAAAFEQMALVMESAIKRRKW